SSRLPRSWAGGEGFAPPGPAIARRGAAGGGGGEGPAPRGVLTTAPAVCCPAPATMMTRVSASSVAVRKASSSSRIITRLWALRTSGRLAVMRRTAPSFLYVVGGEVMVGLRGGGVF